MAKAANRSKAVVLLSLICCLVCFTLIVGVLCLSLSCCALLCVLSCLQSSCRGRESLLLLLSYGCLVTVNVLCLFLAVSWVGGKSPL